jgi:hypothetical protein
VAINNIPRSFQSWKATDLVVATPPDFNLDAGIYGITLATGFTTLTLQKLLPDGVTYVAVTAALVPSSYTTIQLPAGQYRALLAGGANLVGEIALIARGGFR